MCSILECEDDAYIFIALSEFLQINLLQSEEQLLFQFLASAVFKRRVSNVLEFEYSRLIAISIGWSRTILQIIVVSLLVRVSIAASAVVFTALGVEGPISPTNHVFRSDASFVIVLKVSLKDATYFLDYGVYDDVGRAAMIAGRVFLISNAGTRKRLEGDEAVLMTGAE